MRAMLCLPIPPCPGPQLKCLPSRCLNPLNSESSHCLEVAVPSCKILSSSISTEWIDGMIFLNAEDVRVLHVNAIKVDLWNVTLRRERNGGIIMKAM